MSTRRAVLACTLTAIVTLAAALPAAAQSSVRVRGTITAVEGNVLAVKSREGRDLRIELAADATVAVARAARFEDIKPGDYVGSAAMRRPDGSLMALEVHYLAPTVPQGTTAWDLEPGSSMTNANVEAVVGEVGKRELTLRHKDGVQKIFVPEAAPIVRAVPGTRADLKPGEYIFAAVQVAPDGRMTAARLQVSRDGVRPPQ